MSRTSLARSGGVAFVVVLAACAEPVTLPTAALASTVPAGAISAGCGGLHISRSMGARARAGQDCTFTPVPLETAVTAISFAPGADEETLLISNPNPAPARFYEITLPPELELVRHDCAGYIPTVAGDGQCSMTLARRSPTAFNGYVTAKWYMTRADGSNHFGILKVAVAGD